MAAGAFGYLGLKKGTVSANGAGYALTVTYTDVSRAGISSPWDAVVSHPGGFDGPVTLATSIEYLRLFDLNGVFPEPATSKFEGGFVYWEFEPPAGDTLRVHLDTRTQPDVHSGESAVTQLIVDGEAVARVEYTTTVTP